MSSATFPVRCQSCGKVLAHRLAAFEEKLMQAAVDKGLVHQGPTRSDGGGGVSDLEATQRSVGYQEITAAVLDEMGMTNVCCRMVFTTHYPWDEMTRLYQDACEATAPWKLFSDGKVTHLTQAARTPHDMARTNVGGGGGSGGGALSAAGGIGGSSSKPARPVRCYLAR